MFAKSHTHRPNSIYSKVMFHEMVNTISSTSEVGE